MSEKRIVYDLSVFGEVDANGQIEEFYDKKAVENSIIVWLTSYNTDCIRRPNKGGFLTRLLYRPMSEKNITELKEVLIDGLEKDYELEVKLEDLKVEPDFVNKIWNIYIKVYIPEIKDNAEVSVSLKNQV
jgi:hypothetical protein